MGRGSIYLRCRKCRRVMTKSPGRGKPKCPKCGGTEGFWVGQISLGKRADGRRDRRTFYGATREEVEEQINLALADAQRGLTTDPTRETVREYLERWLSDVAAHTVRPVTLESYRNTIGPHVMRNPIGSLPLVKLTPMHLQRRYTEMLAAGLSRRTVQYVHSILHRALEQAVKWNLLPRNPADAVDVPRPERAEMTTLTPEQAQQLAAALEGDHLRTFYLLALLTGARRGELLALRWQDVDLKRGTIRIERTAERVRGRGIVFTEPKTARSRRLIPLPAAAIDLLVQHRKQQLEERLRAGEYYQDHGLVFARPDGTPWNPDHVSQHFAVVLKRAGLPKMRLHDLRHTHATWLFQEGVHPKVVSERLGHSTITITMDVYSHVSPTLQRQAAEKIDSLFGKKSSDQYSQSTANGT